jgi:hypothetical protein
LLKAVWEETLERIEKFSSGEGHEVPVDVGYDEVKVPRLDGGINYAFIKNESPFARLRLAQEGHMAFVSLIAERENRHYVYSMGLLNAAAALPLQGVWDVLNRIEKSKGLQITEGNRWGANSKRGGSPRQTGSLIPPAELAQVLDRYCAFINRWGSPELLGTTMLAFSRRMILSNPKQRRDEIHHLTERFLAEDLHIGA